MPNSHSPSGAPATTWRGMLVGAPETGRRGIVLGAPGTGGRGIMFGALGTGRRGIVVGAVILGLFVSQAVGQLRPVAIRGASVYSGNGGWTEHCTLVVQGGKVSALGANADVPMLARKIEGKGKFVTPGLIDLYAPVAATIETGGDPTASARDAFDRYSEDEIRAALAGGVTAVFVPGTPRDGMGGQGVLVRLRPGASLDEMIVKEVTALCAAVGSQGGQSPVQRVKMAMGLRKQFEEAREYREAWEAYEEELKEYEERLAKHAKGELTGEEEKKGERKGETKPAGEGAAGRAVAGDAEVGSEGENRGSSRESAEGGDAEGGGVAGRKSAEGGAEAGMGSGGQETGDGIEGEPRPRPQRRRPPPSPEDLKKLEELRERSGRGGGEEDAKKKEKKDKLKKPVEPPKDRKKEYLLKILDGEAPFRVEAHRAEDILNVLDLAAKVNVQLWIDGGSAAGLVADKLAAAQVPVVLFPPARRMQFQGGYAEWETEDAVMKLKAAGVKVYLGSGDGEQSRHLALHAAHRVGQGLTADEALEMMTSGAAKLLKVEKEMGRVADGAAADFVVWSGHPFSAGARVERVFVEGVEVYKADDAAE